MTDLKQLLNPKALLAATTLFAGCKLPAPHLNTAVLSSTFTPKGMELEDSNIHVAMIRRGGNFRETVGRAFISQFLLTVQETGSYRVEFFELEEDKKTPFKVATATVIDTKIGNTFAVLFEPPVTDGRIRVFKDEKLRVKLTY